MQPKTLCRIVVPLIVLLTAAQTLRGDTDAAPGSAAPLLGRFVAGGMIIGSPAVRRDGTLLFPADNRYLYALHANALHANALHANALHANALHAGGGEKWRYDLREKTAGSLSVGPDGTAYVLTGDGGIDAVNEAGGRIWRLFGGGGFSRPPAIGADGTIYAPTGEGALYSITHLGRVRWHLPLAGPATAPPVLDADGTLYIATAENETGAPSLAAVYPWARVAWESPLSAAVGVIAAGDYGILYTGDAEGGIRAWGSEGEQLWHAETDKRITSLAALPGGTLAAGTDGGSVLLLGPEGDIFLRVPACEGAVTGIAAGGNGSLYITDSGGSVSALDLSGEKLWTYRTGGVPGPPVLSRDGVLYVGCSDWVLYSFHAASPAAGPWPLPRGTALLNGRVDSPRRRIRLDDYFSRNLDYLYLSTFARSEEKARQLDVLDEIRRRYNEGSMGESEPYLADVLRSLASRAADPFSSVPGSRPIRSPEVRVAALRMLGGLASLLDRRILIGIARYEWEPLIQAEAIRAMGELASDPDGEMSETLLGIIARNASSKTPDERIATAVVEAAEGIFRYHGAAVPSAVPEALQLIVHGSYSRETRTAALKAVRRIHAGEK